MTSKSQSERIAAIKARIAERTAGQSKRMATASELNRRIASTTRRMRRSQHRHH